MYNLHETDVEYPVKMWLYRDICVQDFNLNFGPPRTDSCLTCYRLAAQLSNLDLQDVQRSKLLTQKEMHVRKADSSHKHLNADVKKSKDTSASLEVLTFDMQQTLLIPYLSHSQAFYQRQLWVYNECGHVCSTDDSYMDKASVVSSEVASAILKVLNELRKKKILPANELILWSDECTGQNKTFFIVALWSYAIQRGFASKTRQRFLVSGHTFLPCDRDFSHIE
ncbi:hypothetical protein PR048_030556 [Dryococelus australis]|uniref:DUF7869 domain-containing protein n=1 Tax=Dryococelus australis TaxID=614101 RepID=A0ABQ9G9A5_9NEOP|nr:hypothetical protein PR048_030556 [Dryococelus australis]